MATHRKIEIAAWICHGIYLALFLAVCIVSFFHLISQSTNGSGNCDYGHIAANMALYMGLMPNMPIGLILNICAFHSRRKAGLPYKSRRIHTILTPVYYALVWLAALGLATIVPIKL